MELIKLQIEPALIQDKKLADRAASFGQLITELQKKDLPVEIAVTVNKDIAELNSFSGLGKDLFKLLGRKQAAMINMLEKKLRLVPRNYYRTMWLPLGMSAFGLPIGVAIGISLGNIGLLGIGLPIGMGIGLAVGSAMDRKAKESGRQLDVEVK